MSSFPRRLQKRLFAKKGINTNIPATRNGVELTKKVDLPNGETVRLPVFATRLYAGQITREV